VLNRSTEGLTEAEKLFTPPRANMRQNLKRKRVSLLGKLPAPPTNIHFEIPAPLKHFEDEREFILKDTGIQDPKVGS
jgi:hypothetical protein